MRSAVLAGGAASRFDGKAKGLEKVGGERILDRVVRAIKIATGENPIIVANTDDANTWVTDAEVIRDVHRECGSLAGLHAAIAHAESPVFIAAWDMPFLAPELIEKLMRDFEGNDAVLPASDHRSGVESMCAIYGRKCLEPIEKQIEDEDYRASGFLEHVKHTIIPPEDLESFGDLETLFFNVNTPEDLERAEELWRAKHG